MKASSLKNLIKVLEKCSKLTLNCKIYLGNKVTRQDPGLNYDLFNTEHSLYTNHTKDNRYIIT